MNPIPSALNLFDSLLLKRGIGRGGFNIRLLLGCQGGLFVYDHGRVSRVYGRPVFGVTRAAGQNRYFIAQYGEPRPARGGGHVDTRTTLYEVAIESGSFRIVRTIVPLKSGVPQQPLAVHQIRSDEANLWIANTRQNCVWKLAPSGEVIGEWTGTRVFEWDGASTRDMVARVRASSEYEHYNSIAFAGDQIQILAHNSGGVAKGRKSFIVTLDRELAEISRHTGIGLACHDILHYRGNVYVADSGNGTVLENFTPIVSTDRFLRGLAAFGSILVVGGSVIQQHDANRTVRGGCKLFFVDLDSRAVIAELNLGRVGQIYDMLLL